MALEHTGETPVPRQYITGKTFLVDGGISTGATKATVEAVKK